VLDFAVVVAHPPRGDVSGVDLVSTFVAGIHLHLPTYPNSAASRASPFLFLPHVCHLHRLHVPNPAYPSASLSGAHSSIPRPRFAYGCWMVT
jgi:hypothetical protein